MSNPNPPSQEPEKTDQLPSQPLSLPEKPDEPEISSETSSTRPMNPEEAAHRLILLLTEVNQLRQTLAQEAKRDILLEETLENLDEDDLLIRGHVAVYTRNGEQFRIKLSNPLPGILADYALRDAPKHFENTLFTACVSPLNRKFIAFVNKKVKNKNPVYPRNPLIADESPGAPPGYPDFDSPGDADGGAELDPAD